MEVLRMINRKLSSKIITGLFAVMVGITGVQGVTAYASNYTDTKFEFSFEYGNTCETGVRAKEDKSSVYIYCTQNEGDDCGFNAYAYGCDSYGRDGSECKSNGYSIYYGTKRKMINYIKEDGKNYAYIKGDLKAYDAVYYGGLWSPDSI